MEISTEEPNVTKENQPKEEEEELITDFSQMFKGKGTLRKPPKREVRPVQPTPNWLLQIPAKLYITKEQMCQRKVLNQKRWKSIVKCTDTSDRILASVVSAWNYLFSTKGLGNTEPLTLKRAKEICQQHNIKYNTQNDYQRAQLTISCFTELCNLTNASSSSKVIIKPSIPNQIQQPQAQTLDYFLKGLSDQNTFYLFLTYKTILCPLGFDKTPLVPIDAFKKLQEIKPENIQLWIINGSTQRFQPSFVSKRWSDVKKNLNIQWPYYLDLDEPKKGQQLYEEANEQNKSEARGNSHCIIQFKKI